MTVTISFNTILWGILLISVTVMVMYYFRAYRSCSKMLNKSQPPNNEPEQPLHEKEIHAHIAGDPIPEEVTKNRGENDIPQPVQKLREGTIDCKYLFWLHSSDHEMEGRAFKIIREDYWNEFKAFPKHIGFCDYSYLQMKLKDWKEIKPGIFRAPNNVEDPHAILIEAGLTYNPGGITLEPKSRGKNEHHPAGETCSRHRYIELTDNCSQCGAPRCCKVCCREAKKELVEAQDTVISNGRKIRERQAKQAEALKWYADPDNWQNKFNQPAFSPGYTASPADMDRGNKAREALNSEHSWKGQQGRREQL